jgi:peptide/nickel transport system permease protein
MNAKTAAALNTRETDPAETHDAPPAATIAQRLRRASPVLWLAAGYLIFLFVVAVFGPWLAPYDPIAQNIPNRHAPFSAAHLLGTDEIGRDVASRLMWGARPALLGVLICIATACVIGIPWGLAAGYLGGRIDQVLMRIVDALLVFPGIILCLVLTTVLGVSLHNSMLALGMVYAPSLARVVRSGVLVVRDREFVIVTRLYGASAGYRMWRHVLPNSAGPALVKVTFLCGSAMLAQTGLSFLGIGIQPPNPSWGQSLAESFRYILVNPGAGIAPGVVVVLTVLSFYRVGDALRDKLAVGD